MGNMFATSTSTEEQQNTANLYVAPSKEEISDLLGSIIVKCCADAIKERNMFTIALSGGSLPGFLSTISKNFDDAKINPSYDKWHVILADERCVKSTDNDSNLGALQTKMFQSVPVPTNQIYGMNEKLLSTSESSTDDIAKDYEVVVRNVLSKSGGQLDLAVLGFGPDGHTCSLFPNHDLLKENTKWVAPITDSPKPPPNRITLTFPVLNDKTRNVIFCGAGKSKEPILQKAFDKVISSKGDDNNEHHVVQIADPPPYPCAMVKPNNTLSYVIDADAMPSGLLKM